MTTKQLIELLKALPEDMQIFISSDEEGNNILKIDTLVSGEFQKQNGKGTYEAIIIYPTSEYVEQY